MPSHRDIPAQSGAWAARPEPAPTIFIVDDDDEVRLALERLLHADYRIRSFATASGFFAAHDPEIPGCIVLDVLLPETDGLAVQAALTAAGCVQPVIFLSACDSISMTVRALRAGAVDFLTKPVRAEAIVAAIRAALTLGAIRRQSMACRRAAAKRLSSLTQRERQVLNSLVNGRLNKQIAADLGIVENTVKAHRARIMQKLDVRGLAELVLFTSTHDAAALPDPVTLDTRSLQRPTLT
jgi:FixJ family two-component response regulator